MIEKMERIIAPIKYIGGASTYFCFHITDNYLVLVSYLGEGGSNV